MYYHHRQRGGKNAKLPYYLAGLARFYGPSGHLRRRLDRMLASLEGRHDEAYIRERVDYYNKLSEPTPLGPDASPITDLSLLRGKSAYVLDTQEYLRWFPRRLLWNHLFGDVTRVPDRPTILKSRPIAGDNRNSVLLNLDKVRHFNFLDDKTPFRDKQSRFVFRGYIARRANRIAFMERFFGHELCDAASSSPGFEPAWSRPPAGCLPVDSSPCEQLRYRYIMALEGNDVATNLKWAMSSNSVAVMPAPTYETWFMEGRLVGGVHYIEVAPDFSDLLEKIAHYEAHPEQAEQIARNANDYIRQFLDPRREELISLMVLDKYFRLTGQER